MATISTKLNKDGSVRYSIQFIVVDDATRRKTRKTLTLGSRYAKRQVDLICRQIERLVDCRASAREPDASVSVWLDEIDAELREKLAAVGLIKAREIATLATIFSRFEESAKFSQYAPNSVRNYLQSRKRFFQYFDPTERPDDLTLADVENWKRDLESGYSDATVAGMIKVARTVFNWAVKQELIQKHKFNSISRGSFKNKSREFYVSLDWYRRLLDAAPNRTWRAIVALCRIGGLRCPSEVLEAQWSDVLWSDERFVVRDVKRKTTRVIPLFPELRTELEELFAQTTDASSPYIVDKYRRSVSLRQGFEKIVDLAGLPRWERLFHNLRGSRSNELFSQFPTHVAGAWMGQSESVALQHYLHPTDDDYRKAANGQVEKNRSDVERAENDCRNDCRQYGTELDSTGQHRTRE